MAPEQELTSQGKLIFAIELMGMKEWYQNFMKNMLRMMGKREEDVNNALEYADYDSIIADFAEKKADYFTDEELDATIAFHTSKVGKSFMKKFPNFALNFSEAVNSAAEKKINEFFEKKAKARLAGKNTKC